MQAAQEPAWSAGNSVKPLTLSTSQSVDPGVSTRADPIPQNPTTKHKSEIEMLHVTTKY